MPVMVRCLVQWKKLGTIGDVRCFSFFSNKNISTGERYLITNNEDMAKKARFLRSHEATMSCQPQVAMLLHTILLIQFIISD